MTDRKRNRYPIYVPSKGRAEYNLTARMFVKDNIDFRLVIEEPEWDAYAEKWGEDRLLVLPFSDAGSVVPARNWIRDHAESEGHAKHWQFDDNIRSMIRLWGEKRLYVRSGIALRVCEDFTDRYSNVAISGFQYSMFVPESRATFPWILNCRVYSASLINHAAPFRWRGKYNEDTDLCLQALASGWCTILIQAFLADKIWTMKMGGGNTDTLYGGKRVDQTEAEPDDGRLKMARSLERMWPGTVRTNRRFDRPQHVVASSWKKFDNELIRDPNVKITDGIDEYGMELKELNPVKSKRLKAIARRYRNKHGQ